jgi:hypothetical protein
MCCNDIVITAQMYTYIYIPNFTRETLMHKYILEKRKYIEVVGIYVGKWGRELVFN